MTFEERLRLVLDEARSGFNHTQVEGLIDDNETKSPLSTFRPNPR
ncbi:hypothetical protein ACFRAU_12740 [Arthrobacter sp. NPDC056691]